MLARFPRRPVPALSMLAALLGALTLLLLASAASAQTRSDEEVNQIIRRLAPIAGQTVSPGPTLTPQPSPTDVLTRPAPGTAAPVRPPQGRTEIYIEVVVQDRVILIDPTYSMDFEVFFAFDSAELTARARRDLSALGWALESPELRGYGYLIAGHTDAVGNPAYNQRLSERRAAAVRDFLVRNFAIEPWRLVSVGFGQERLRDPANPRAAINRRVEVAMIVPQAR